MIQGNSVRIFIPDMVPPSPNELRRRFRNPHAYARLRDRWMHAIFYLTPLNERNLLKNAARAGRVRVELTIHNSREYDPDNLHGCQKPVLDALTQLEFIHDDSSRWLQLESPRYVKSANVRLTEIMFAPFQAS